MNKLTISDRIHQFKERIEHLNTKIILLEIRLESEIIEIDQTVIKWEIKDYEKEIDILDSQYKTPARNCFWCSHMNEKFNECGIKDRSKYCAGFDELEDEEE